MQVQSKIPLTQQERTFVGVYGRALKVGGEGMIVGQDQRSVIRFTVRDGGAIVVLERKVA